MTKTMEKTIMDYLNYFAKHRWLNHIVAFTFFCDRQVQRYVKGNPAWVSTDIAAAWVADAVAAGDAVLASSRAGDAAVSAANTASAATWNAVRVAKFAEGYAWESDAWNASRTAEFTAQREQLDFLEYIFSTTIHYRKKYGWMKLEGILL
jgi:hypothetical protein